jgi:hypothetical protein
MAVATPMVGRTEPVVPGTGAFLSHVSDDFEDADWSFRPNLPKSSEDLDKKAREPRGRSTNGLWAECLLRGMPDVVERVATPPDGLPGSTASLLLQTRRSGNPTSVTRRSQQDDIQMNMIQRLGGPVPVSQSPSVLVRVYIPSLEEWEPRRGASFAFRADVTGTRIKPAEGFLGLGGNQQETDHYWPGIFLMRGAGRGGPGSPDRVYMTIRGNERGRDVEGPEITEFGWWTLGMSFTPDGRVHYFARPGVDDLTASDHLATRAPYGYRCQEFNTIFFDVWCQDDGQTWSTPWAIDDPSLYRLGATERTAGKRGRSGTTRRGR